MSAVFYKIKSRSAWSHLTALLFSRYLWAPVFLFIPTPPMGNSGWSCPLRAPPRNPGERIPHHLRAHSILNAPLLGTQRRPASIWFSLLGKALLPLLSHTRRLALWSAALAPGAKAHGCFWGLQFPPRPARPPPATMRSVW